MDLHFHHPLPPYLARPWPGTNCWPSHPNLFLLVLSLSNSNTVFVPDSSVPNPPTYGLFSVSEPPLLSSRRPVLSSGKLVIALFDIPWWIFFPPSPPFKAWARLHRPLRRLPQLTFLSFLTCFKPMYCDLMKKFSFPPPHSNYQAACSEEGVSFNLCVRSPPPRVSPKSARPPGSPSTCLIEWLDLSYFALVFVAISSPPIFDFVL